MGNQTTPKNVQKLQMALQAKAKAEAGYRFYALYDKISREDSLMLFLFGSAGFFGTLAAGWLMGLHLSATHLVSGPCSHRRCSLSFSSAKVIRLRLRSLSFGASSTRRLSGSARRWC
ncbi:hypothetical protein [Bradyrhizobium erythrophlei]|uniref:hypothetical protein n=1 Tax=Bradyrhizobium erythrophlei TaxID=1437360 RepID=UPI000B83D455|nr:hypothetical protein [Bradyrhizobium erythrophlei]